jgi:hypothetical protein
MKQVLNEELFRIQEIMGIKKTIINEDFQSEQNNLISEQGGEIAALLKGASTAGKFEKTGISAIDNVVRTQTDMLSRVKGSKIPSGGYNTLEEFTQAIARKEIPSDIAEQISETLMKKIIVTPEGSKIVGKVWFESGNVAKQIRQTFKKIANGDSLPPDLVIKMHDDFQLTVSKINTGDPNIDNALKNSLETNYGVPLKKAKDNAENTIKKAQEFETNYSTMKSEVIEAIESDPDLSVKKVRDKLGLYDKKAKELYKQGDYQARQYLLKKLQKPTFMSILKNLFTRDSIVFKFLNDLLSYKGLIWALSASGLYFIYQLVFIGDEKLQLATSGNLGKLKENLPTLKPASDKILNSFTSVAPQSDIDNLIMKKEGYSVKFNEQKDTPIGDIQELTVTTPTKIYEYTYKKDSDSVEEKITPAGGASGAGGGGNSQGLTDQDKQTFIEKANKYYNSTAIGNLVTLENGVIKIKADNGTQYSVEKTNEGNFTIKGAGANNSDVIIP